MKDRKDFLETVYVYNFRTSAAWVERRSKSKHNLNAHFDKKVVRDRYPNSRKSHSGKAIDMPQTNYYKMTPTEEV